METASSQAKETSLIFRSRSEWVAWLGANRWATNREYIDGCAAEVSANGFIDPLFGFIRPGEFVVADRNYREGIVARSLNSRLRAVCLVLLEEMLAKGPGIEIYASEAVSPFARVVRDFVRLTGSEYLPTVEAQSRHPGLRHEDVMALSFPEQSFDAYITNEVLEHIPEIPPALREAYRILRPSGLFFGTFPMAYASPTTVKKAEIVNGDISYLQPPEYHGNPVDPEGGCLVFNIPGWDIVEQARAAGFPDPYIRFVSSRRHATFGAELAGILLFVARRD